MSDASQDPGRAVVRPADSVRSRVVDAGSGTQVQVLVGPDDGAPNFAMRRFTMQQGGGMPLHTNMVEHEQYVLRGQARITIGTDVHEVGPNDTLYIPAGTLHSYEVVAGPFEFLCVVPNGADEVKIMGDPG